MLDTCSVLEVNSSHVSPPLWSESTTIYSASRVQMLKCVLLLYFGSRHLVLNHRLWRSLTNRATYQLFVFVFCFYSSVHWFDLFCLLHLLILNVKYTIRDSYCFYLEILSSCIISNNMIYLRRHYIGIVAKLRSITGILWHFVQHDRLFPLCIDDEWLYESLYSAIWNVYWEPQWELYILCEK